MRRGTFGTSGTDPACRTHTTSLYTIIPYSGSQKGRGAGTEEVGLPEVGVVVAGGFCPVRSVSANGGGRSCVCSQVSCSVLKGAGGTIFAQGEKERECVYWCRGGLSNDQRELSAAPMGVLIIPGTLEVPVTNV